MPKGTPLGDISNGKVCPACKEHKPLEQFSKNRHSSTGYTSYCKPCAYARFGKLRERDPEYVARKGREWRAKNPERARDLLLRYNYGIEIGTYGTMLAAQAGLCAICKTEIPGGNNIRFHVDHCHDTKKVRGLLCHHCNIGLGNFFHSSEKLSAAIRYLAESGAESGG